MPATTTAANETDNDAARPANNLSTTLGEVSNVAAAAPPIISKKPGARLRFFRAKKDSSPPAILVDDDAAAATPAATTPNTGGVVRATDASPGTATPRSGTLSLSLPGAFPAGPSQPIGDTDAAPEEETNIEEEAAVADAVTEELHLVEASLVPDNSESGDRNIGQEDTVVVEAHAAKLCDLLQHRSLQFLLGCFCCIAIVGIVIALLIPSPAADETNFSFAPSIAPSDMPSSHPSVVPSSMPSVSGSPTNAPTQASFPETLPRMTQNAANDTRTPQHKAYQWVHNLTLASIPEWQKFQIFAMACLYYSYHGSIWTIGSTRGSRNANG